MSDSEATTVAMRAAVKVDPSCAAVVVITIFDEGHQWTCQVGIATSALTTLTEADAVEIVEDGIKQWGDMVRSRS